MMSRPKRTRILPSAPSCVAEIPKTQPGAQSTRSASPASSERTMPISTDSDGLVTRNALARNRRGVSAKQARMSGALAPGDEGAVAQLQHLYEKPRNKLGSIAKQASNARRKRQHRADKDRQGSSVIDDGDDGAAGQRNIIKSTPAASLLDSKSSFSAGVGRSQTAAELSTLGTTFKPRQRKPSLLRALKVQQAQAVGEDVDDDDDSFDVYSFGPDDESTPLQQKDLPSTLSAQASVNITSCESRKRKRGEAQIPQLQVAGTVPLLDSSLPATCNKRAKSRLLTGDSFDIAVDSPSSEPLLPLLPYTSRGPRSVEQSSPPRSLTCSPLSTLSSAQTSPARPKRDLPIPKPLTTACLQNLLPRRKIRKSTDASRIFELESSDAETSVNPSSDADELSFHAAKASHRRTVATRGKFGTRAPKSPPPPPQQQKSRTYSSAAHQADPTISDLESSDMEENDSTFLSLQKSADVPKLPSPARKKLQATARFFQEVDNWNLEVEDVSMHSQSSVMKDAR